MPELSIDNRSVHVPEGTSILRAAALLGIEIPVFCHHEGLSLAGHCQMCLVEVEGVTEAVQSCCTVVADGMVVRTRSPMVIRARAATLAALMAQHPIDCPVCDSAGDCDLQDNYFRNRAGPPATPPGHPATQVPTAIGQRVLLHRGRCINCTRCVRFSTEVSKSNELVQVSDGERTTVGLRQGHTFTDPYSLCTVDLCPAGALTARDFRSAPPAWTLSTTASICPECARGCALTVWHTPEKLCRLQPRYSAKVNGWWACDHGRLAYAQYYDDRITRGYGALRRAQEEVLDPVAAARFGARWLRETGANGGRVALVLDASLSLEEGYAIFSFAQQAITTSQAFLALPADGQGDHLLRQPQQAANARGLTDMAAGLGIALLPASGLFAEGRLWSAVVCFGAEFDLPRPADPAQAGRVLLFAWRHNRVTRIAHTLVPIPAHFEKRGHYVNCDGIMQYAEAVIRPPANVKPLPLLLKEMAMETGMNLGYAGPSELSHMALSHPSRGDSANE